MPGVARSESVLAKRVKRFLSREREKDERLAELLRMLGRRGGVYLFGGVLRDIALFGIRQFDSDIDFVYVGGEFSLRRGLERTCLNPSKNRFGGLRIATTRWDVDIWRASDSWAFREGLREYEGIRSLLETTITNWESILYRLDGGGLICGKTYFEDLNAGFLDVVFDENPNVLGMYVRLFRACVYKDVALLSEKAASIIREGLSTYSYEAICKYESSHYQDVYLTRTMWDWLSETMSQNDGSPYPVALGSVQGHLVP